MEVDTQADSTPRLDAEESGWADLPPEVAENRRADLPPAWIHVAVARAFSVAAVVA